MRVSKRVRSAVKRNSREFMAKGNVVGVGAGKEEKDGKKTGRDAVLVLVKKKLPLAQLAADDLVPREVNEDGNVVATDVIEVGEIVALHKDDHRPMVPGTSCGHYNITAGTLGLFVRKNGVPYILSNNHVLADSNNANIGDAIYQPGPTDGGREKHTVAELSDFVEISWVADNLVDCAIARVTLNLSDQPPLPEPPVEDDPTPIPPKPPKEKEMDFFEKIFAFIEKLFKSIFFFWKKDDKQVVEQQAGPVRLADPLAVEGIDFTNQPLNMETPITGQLAEVDVGDYIQKSGRTTGYTEGEVLAVDAVVDVNYGEDGVGRFEDQLLCSYMSKGGDSGSAVFDVNGNLVGLLFAGSATVTILNKIEHVFQALGIDEID